MKMKPLCFAFICATLVGCKGDELGETPPVPVPPVEAFSQRAVCFDGQSSLSQIDATQLFPNAALALPVNPLAISAWVRMKSQTPTGIIFGLNDDPNTYLHLAWLAGGVLEYKTIYNSQTHTITRTIANPKAWHHVVIQFDGGSSIPQERKMMFVDGVPQGADFPMELNLFAGRTFQISPPNSPLSEGCVDDMGIWDRPLSATEVQSLSRQGSPAAFAGAVKDVDTLWLMEEDPSSNIIHDEKNNFDMNFVGALSIQSALVDPFQPGNGDDPLDVGNAGDNKGDGGSSSGPLDGGSGGYGGELGDGNNGDDGLFP